MNEEPDEENERGGEEPPRFDFEDIQELTDAAMLLFVRLNDHEKKYKRWLERQTRAAMRSDLDLTGPAEHYQSHEDYTPSERPEAGCS